MKKWMKKEVVITLLVVVLMFAFYILGTSNNNNEQMEPEGVSTISDMEIITMANHPKLLESIEEADKLWELNRDRVVAYDADQSSAAKLSMQNKMLYLKGYGDSIKEIQIYFNRMREENLTFDQVIEITISYLPWNILNEQYEAYTANRVSKIEDPEKNAVYYEIMFTKKEGATQSLPYEIGAVITAYPDGTYESRIECNPELQNLVLNGLEINTWDIELSH